MSVGSILRFVVRETRGSRLRLFLVSLTGLIGVTLLVVFSLTASSIERAIDLESRALLGADVVLVRHEPWDTRSEEVIARLPGEHARELSFLSMLNTPDHRGRLASIRAVEPGFPFYGTIETSPAGVMAALQDAPSAVVERSILLEHHLAVGDSLSIGAISFRILGTVEQVPGDSPIAELVAPRVFIAERYAEGTGLLRTGSRATYRVALKLPESMDADDFVRAEGAAFDEIRVTAETVSQRRRAIEHVVENMQRFLNLGGIAVILLASIGIAHGVATYLEQRRPTVALLRALGATESWIVSSFLLQLAAASFVSSLLGVCCGAAIASAVPGMLGDVLPLPVRISWQGLSILPGLLLGVALPLLSAYPAIRRCSATSPLAVLGRREDPASTRDLALASLGPFAAVAAVLVLAGRPRDMLLLVGGAALCSFLLAGIVRVVVRLGRRLTARAPVPLRCAVRNLARPGNHTTMLTVAIAYALLLPSVLVFISSMLGEQIRAMSGDGRPNTALFGIDPGQVGALSGLLAERGAPVIDDVPVVTMRMAAIKGRPVREVLAQSSHESPPHEPPSRADSSHGIPEWTLRREYRSTYRSGLSDSETLVAGELAPHASGFNDVPISLEEGLAEKLHLTLGDAVDFDVQGLTVHTIVRSLRKVAWQQVKPNFFVVFPAGVLEGAPQTHILTTRIEGVEDRARVAEELLAKYPNVSFIDLQFVLKALDAVIARLSLGARIVAVAISLTAAMMVLGIVLNDWGTRLRELALFKVLGATRRQLLLMTLCEYLVIGLVAAFVGIICAAAVSHVLLTSVFHLQYTFAWTSLILTAAAAVVVSTALGAIGAAGIYAASPLLLLRES